MEYICPHLTCPYCGKHTYYVIGKYQVWISKQTCSECGKTFNAISILKGTSVNPYKEFPDEIDLEEDIFIHYGTSKLKEDEELKKEV